MILEAFPPIYQATKEKLHNLFSLKEGSFQSLFLFEKHCNFTEVDTIIDQYFPQYKKYSKYSVSISSQCITRKDKEVKGGVEITTTSSS